MHTVLNEETKDQVKACENQTIFDAFDENNLVLPHGCLAGSCGACLVEITQGIELLNEMSIIEENTIQSLKNSYKALASKDLRLSCRARVRKEGEVKFSYISKSTEI